MLFRIVLLTVLVIVTANPLQRSSAPEELMSIFELEEACVRQGGMCIPVTECDPGNLVQIRGVLCPMQSHLGVECCYFE